MRVDCSQRKVIRDDNLEIQIEKEIEKYTILPEFLEWPLEGLNKKNDTEINDRTTIYETQHKAITQAQKELDELTKMRYRQLIDDDTFLKGKKELQAQISQLQRKLRETEARADKWLEFTEKTFHFATYARKVFLFAKGKEGLELKKEILMGLRELPIIKDQMLAIAPHEWLQPFENNCRPLKEEYLGLELDKKPLTKAQTEALASVRARWLGGKDEVRTNGRKMEEMVTSIYHFMRSAPSSFRLPAVWN